MNETGTVDRAHELLGRVALVTGAAGGLGRGIAAALAERGATVICADIRDADDVANALPHGRGHATTLDVVDSTQVDTVLNALVGVHGRLDLLVNNAGLAQRPTPLFATTDDVIEHVLGVNVKGVLYCSRAAVRIMIKQRSGRIINISSQAGKCGAPNWAVYSASKAAVIAATQALALEVAQYSITVNCICPGPMLTEMTRASIRAEAEANLRDEAERLAELCQSVPVGRFGTPEDVGAMVAWIASEESAFTTGASFNLTGGVSVFF